MASKLFPMLDRVLVRRAVKELKTASGILLPETSSSQINEAVVVAVGPGGRSRDGNLIPLTLKEGDRVLLPEFGGQKVKLDKEELFFYREEDIIAVLKN